jgi:two-component system, cell cycle sensor histidine kinase and response regulator CckA
MTGVLTLIAGLLQLIVPSYALSLVHRFGAKRVGWFVVTAFSSLALLHLFAPLKPSGTASGNALDVIFAVGSILLLIGMGHVETMISERERATSTETNLRNEWDTRFSERVSNLTRANEKLMEQIARHEEQQRELAFSEAYYRSLFAENPQPMWVFDLRTCRLLAGNNAALRQYGFSLEEFLQLTVWDLMPGGANSDFEKSLSRHCAGPQPLGLSQHCTRDRALIDVEMVALDLNYGDAAARLMLTNEITHRRRHELEVRKVQKMEVITHVTAGVAQHFNNILSVIENNAALLLPIVKDSKAAEQLQNISGAASRGNSLTRKLLATGGRRPMQPEVVDLNHLIRNMNHMLTRLVGDQIVMNQSYGSHLTPVLADPRLVEEIIINLVLNARDAMSRQGTISLATSAAVVDNLQTNGQSRVGQFICLSVRDTGPGMTPEVQASIFEPFFTTNENGQSFGLGLASIYGLVRQHSGWVEYSTEVGMGTEFKVFLPCAPATAILAQAEVRKPAPKSKGTVMLVEPDDRVRSMARFVLNQNGYQVIEADCGSIALLLWEGQGAQVNLLLTDVSLPGDISGTELAKRLQQNRADLRVIYTAAALPADRSLKFIPKPYRPDRLLKEVQGASEDKLLPVVS